MVIQLKQLEQITADHVQETEDRKILTKDEREKLTELPSRSDLDTKLDGITQSYTEAITNAIAGIVWKNPVASMDDLAIAYPEPQNGWVAFVVNEGKAVRYCTDCDEWDDFCVPAVLYKIIRTQLTLQLTGTVTHDSVIPLDDIITVDGTVVEGYLSMLQSDANHALIVNGMTHTSAHYSLVIEEIDNMSVATGVKWEGMYTLDQTDDVVFAFNSCNIGVGPTVGIDSTQIRYKFPELTQP